VSFLSPSWQSWLLNLLFWVFAVFRVTLPWLLLLVLILVWVGWHRGWRWIRNPWIRILHLVFAGMLLADAWCPYFGVTDVTYRTLSTISRTPLSRPATKGPFVSSVVSSHRPSMATNRDWVQPLLYFNMKNDGYILIVTILFWLILMTFFLRLPWWRGRPRQPPPDAAP